MSRIMFALLSFWLLIVGGVVAYFWTSESGAKIAAYEELRKTVSKIEHFSRLSKLELLKIHNGIVLNYTALARYEDEIRILIGEIRKNPAYNSDEMLYFRFEGFASARIAEDLSVESFKTISALLRNSQAKFAEESEAILLGLTVQPKLDALAVDWLRNYVALTIQLRSWITESHADNESDPPSVLASLESASPMAQALAHGEQAQRLKDQLHEIIDEVFSQYYDDFYLSLLDYLDNRIATLSSEAATRKIYLKSAVILLCLMILLAIGLLLAALRRVREARASLEERVAERTRQLTDKSKELERYHSHLEEQVEARTVELDRKAQELAAALVKEKEYNKLQKDFVSMISHEFRTPVAIIDMAAQRILRKKAAGLPPEAFEEFATGIRKNTRRLTGLIDRTLTSSKFREGQLEFTPVKFSLTHLLTDICAQHEKLGPDHTIRTEIELGIPEITGDMPMLEQVFSNLVGNAIKYSPEKTPVVVRAARLHDTVRVDVIDQGIGIPMEELPKLFERYFRASNARVIAGTGLGLAIAKEMIEMHGGTLQVATDENKGSTFTITLPIERQRVEASAATEEHYRVA